MSKTARERRDRYYAAAKQESYRARSAYKLLQIDSYLDLLNVDSAVDLCAAPGSWSQVLAGRVKRVVAVDLAPIAPISDNVIIIEGDITSEATAAAVVAAAGGRAGLVVCDGAPDVTGLHDLDEYVQAQLIDAALGICARILRAGGCFVAKVFRGELTGALLQEAAQKFADVRIVKPAASRGSSMEAFLVARGFFGWEGAREGERPAEADQTAAGAEEQCNTDVCNAAGAADAAGGSGGPQITPDAGRDGKMGVIRWEVETCGMDGPDSDRTYQ